MKLLSFQTRPPAGDSRESLDHAVARVLLESLDHLYATAYRLIGRADAAEDLVQETAHKALRAAASLKDQRNLRAWLFTILVRALRDHVRRSQRWEKWDGQMGPVPPAPDVENVSLAAAQDVRSALDRLPPPQRAVVILVDLEEFTIAEAAQMLELPAGTVASRLARAHHALREMLQAYASRSSEIGGQP